MNARRGVLLLVCASSLAAWAQADDLDLTPLPPAAPKPAKAKAAKAKAPPKAKATKAPPKAKDDDDLTPLVALPKTGEVVVKVGAITRAVLSIDGKEVGQLPLAPQQLSAGEHTLTIRRPGFTQFVKKITVVANKQLDVEAKLTAVAAVISVTSDVPDAQVLINGRVIGTAPLSDYEVAPGPVTLTVLKEGLREDQQKLNLVAGTDYPIEVRLKAAVVATDRPVEATLQPMASADPSVSIKTPVVKEPALYERWYFWAGVAAVVAAAAAGTAVAVSANAAPRRLGEGEICTAQGKCDGCIGFVCQAAGVAQSPLMSRGTNPAGLSF